MHVENSMHAKLTIPGNFEKYNRMRTALLSFCSVGLLLTCSASWGQPVAVPKKPSKIFAENLEMRDGMAYSKNRPYTGTSVKLWDNKVVNEEIQWVNGLKDGVYKEFTENNILVATETWSEGVKHGPYAYYYPNGAVKNTGTFQNEKLEGEITGYYPNGNKQYSVFYSSGVRNGSNQTWFTNGNKEQTTQFVNDVPHGDVFAWYPTGLPRYQISYNMGVKHGAYYKYHKSGCPAEENYFKNGKRDSIYRLYDEIGCKLIAEEYYLNGEKNGLFIKYGFKGDTLSVETWQSGQREGRYAEWRDRETETTGFYSAGERHGYWKHGFSSHYQMREGSYNKGITTGEWRFYDDKGRLLAIQWYNDDGEEIKSKFFKKRK
jgi:antitoxin component YwqK of YwqJK toxin-antitoxin module